MWAWRVEMTFAGRRQFIAMLAAALDGTEGDDGCRRKPSPAPNRLDRRGKDGQFVMSKPKPTKQPDPALHPLMVAIRDLFHYAYVPRLFSLPPDLSIEHRDQDDVRCAGVVKCVLRPGGRVSEPAWEYIRRLLERIQIEQLDAPDSPTAKQAIADTRAIAKLLLDAVQKNEAGEAAVLALQMGCILYRLWNEYFEGPIDTGQKVRKGGKKGSEDEYGTAEEQRADHERRQRAIEEKLSKNPALSFDAACQLVADSEGVCKKTIKRHAINPRTKGKRTSK